MTRFTNIALSAATALGIALAPVPAAAGPDGEDIAKALAGLAVLGIVAKVASDRDKRRDRAATQSAPQYGTVDDHNRRIIDGNFRSIDEPVRNKKRGFKKAKLPDRCLRVVETRRSDRYVYGNRCLNRHYKFASKLPERCVRYVRTDRGLREVYAARCLARDGWRVAQR